MPSSHLDRPPNFICPKGKLAFERGPVELGDVCQQCQRSVRLQPGDFGVERGIPASLPERQSKPVNLPQLAHMLR